MSLYIPSDLRREVREYFGGYCGYCHSPEILMAVTFELEHIVPVSAGGMTAFENLALACPTCNRHKASRQSAPDPATGEAVSLFHPQQQAWDEHFAWIDGGAQLIGLTPTGRVTIETLRMNRLVLVHVRRLWIQLGEHP